MALGEHDRVRVVIGDRTCLASGQVIDRTVRSSHRETGVLASYSSIVVRPVLRSSLLSPQFVIDSNRPMIAGQRSARAAPQLGLVHRRDDALVDDDLSVDDNVSTSLPVSPRDGGEHRVVDRLHVPMLQGWLSRRRLACRPRGCRCARPCRVPGLRQASPSREDPRATGPSGRATVCRSCFAGRRRTPCIASKRSRLPVDAPSVPRPMRIPRRCISGTLGGPMMKLPSGQWAALDLSLGIEVDLVGREQDRVRGMDPGAEKT